MYYLNKQVIHKKIHVLMLEDELKKRQFLSRIGAFSVKKGSRNSLITLNYIRKITKIPENLIVLYPQGKIHSIYQHEIQFEKGIFKALEDNKQFETFFAACLPDFSNSKKTFIQILLEKYSESMQHQVIEKYYNRFLEKVKQQQIQKINLENN
ncbi:hypothetical protein ACFLSA_00085 [Bacteroidota bacterium]